MTDLTEAEQAETAETLSSVFEDEPEKEDEGAAESEDEGQSTGVSEKEEKSSEEEKEASPPEDKEDEKLVPIAALLGERKLRQEAQEELKKYKEKESEQKEAVPVPDPVEDPEGYAAHVGKIAVDTKITVSRDLLMSTAGFEDYQDMENKFVELTKENPALIAKMRNAPNPAKFAYQTAKDHLEFEAFKEMKKSGADKKAPSEPSEAEKRKLAATRMPDLTKATAHGKESADLEKQPSNPKEEIDQIFSN